MTRLTSDRRSRFIAAAFATVLAPLTILAHEAGHFLAYVTFGFPDPRLHYARAGWEGLREFTQHMQAGDLAAAESIANVTLAGVSTAAGPLVTYVAIGLGLWALHRFESVAGAALAVGASARVVVFISAVTGQAQTSDEASLSRAFQIPEIALHLVGLFAFMAAVGGTFVLLKRQGRGRLLVPLAVGTVFGTGLWMGILGQVILP